MSQSPPQPPSQLLLPPPSPSLSPPLSHSLSLPTWPVTLVYATACDGTDSDSSASQSSQSSQITLPDYLSAHHAGLILYFYPKDNTAGCSVQAQAFSQYQAKFAELGYQIIGVSRGSIHSHKKFIDAKQITFALISDTDEALCHHFHVIGEKLMYGKKVRGVVRSTFIFDKMGQPQHQLRNVRAKGHVERVLALLSDGASSTI